METKKLIVYTIGGTPEPIVISLTEARPERVIFLASDESESKVTQEILPAAAQKGFGLSPGQYRIDRVSDAQDFEACVSTARSLEPEVHQWLQRGQDFSVAADLTGGTKCMAAALALVASRWKADFLYVGGGTRDKGGLGVVVSGSERLLRRANPWNSLGYQAIDDAALYFDAGLYAAGAKVLETAKRRMTQPGRGRELATLQLLAQLYDSWDRFDFKGARDLAAKVLTHISDLRHALPHQAAEIEQTLQDHQNLLAQLLANQPSALWVRDLLANARRRAMLGNYDDAVARLYRAVEAHGQLALEKYGLKARTSLSDLPPDLQEKWAKRAREDGALRLGLRSLYELLGDLGDPLAAQFEASGLAERGKSPLEMRNNSILAHGFDPLTEKGFRSFWRPALELTGVQEAELVVFPKLRAG